MSKIAAAMEVVKASGNAEAAEAMDEAYDLLATLATATEKEVLANDGENFRAVQSDAKKLLGL